MGSGRDSVGGVVTSDIRDPWFESSHHQILFTINFISSVLKKSPGMDHFYKQASLQMYKSNQFNVLHILVKIVVFYLPSVRLKQRFRKHIPLNKLGRLNNKILAFYYLEGEDHSDQPICQTCMERCLACPA